MASKASPTTDQLREARSDFRSLLARSTTEPQWQSFFAKNPFVLSQGLPLQLSPADIMPLGRPGRSEPDFLIYPGSTESLQTHGIVELKTHKTRVLRQARKNVITLSADAQTALRQVEKYNLSFDAFSLKNRVVSFSAARYLFIIIGDSREIAEIDPALYPDIETLLAPARFLPFDELLENFSRAVPSQLVFLHSCYNFIPGIDLSPLIVNGGDCLIELHRLDEANNLLTIGPIKLASSAEDQAKLEKFVEESYGKRGKIRYHNDPYINSRFFYGSRFNGPFLAAGNSALCCSETRESSEREILFFRRKFFSEFGIDRPTRPIEMVHTTIAFQGRMACFDGNEEDLTKLFDLDYTPSITLAKNLIESGFDAVRYKSSVYGGYCYVVFNPASLGEVKRHGSIWLA